MVNYTKALTPYLNSLNDNVLKGQTRVFKGDKPPSQRDTIQNMALLVVKGSKFMEAYNMRFEGFMLLLSIVSKWLSFGQGSTVYSLSLHRPKGTTMIGLKVNSLLKKDLITIIGYGKFGANIYAPTKLALSELREYLGVV